MGDMASCELAVAGYGYGTNGGSWVGGTAVTGQFIVDVNNPIALPAELPDEERQPAALWQYVNGGVAGLLVRAMVLRPNDPQAPSSFTLCGHSDPFDNPPMRTVVDLRGRWHWMAGETQLTNGDVLGLHLAYPTPRDLKVAGAGQAGGARLLAAEWSTGPLSGMSTFGYDPLLALFVDTTRKRFEIAAAPGATARLPYFRSVPYFLVLDEVRQPDGGSLTFTFQGVRSTDAPAGTKADVVTAQALVLDHGATDQVTYGGVSAALAAGEAGGVFTFLIGLDPATKAADLYYADLTRGQAGGSSAADVALICHAVRAASARGARHPSDGGGNGDDLRWSRLAIASSGGAPSIGRVMVARRPWVGGVSSWSARYEGHMRRAHVAEALHDASAGRFACPPCVVSVGIPGGRLALDTSTVTGFQRRFGAADGSTPGLHDVCELRGAVVFVEAGGAVNDLVSAASAEGNRPGPGFRQALRDCLAAVARIVRLAMANGNEVVIADAPPITLEVGGEECGYWYLSEARRRYNAALHALCAATGAVFVSTEAAVRDATPVLSHPAAGSPRTLEDRLRPDLRQDAAHLAAAGDAEVALRMARAYEGAGAAPGSPGRGRMSIGL